MTAQSIFALLATAQFGAYVVSWDQSILSWNKAAERISGYPGESVLGRRCYEVLSGLIESGLTAECRQGCPSIHSMRAGQIPSTMRTRILCASGERKLVSITPMVIGGLPDGGPMIAHLFTDVPAEQASSPAGYTEPVGNVVRVEPPAYESPSGGTSRVPQRITGRELEVLRLVALGWDTPSIAAELGISQHTVLNHIRHFRRKLDATTKLDAVVTAIRLGMLIVD